MFQQWSGVLVPHSELPAFLRRQIETRGTDASRLARKSGVNKSTLSKLLSNSEIVPELTTLEKLARALELPLVRLMVAAGYDPGEGIGPLELEQAAILLDAVPELQEVAHSLASFSPDERGAILAYIRLLEEQRQ